MPTPRRKWFSQYSSIIDEPWPLKVKARLQNLLALLMERYWRDGVPAHKIGEALLDMPAVLRITEASKPDYAFNALMETIKQVSGSPHYGEISAREVRRGRRRFVEISWPNLAEIQKIGGRPPGRPAGVIGVDRAPYDRTGQYSTSKGDRGLEEGWVLSRLDQLRIHGWLRKQELEVPPPVLSALLAKREREWRGPPPENAAAVFQHWLKEQHRTGSLEPLIARMQEEFQR
jgi:hypothetical protein